MTDKQTQNKHKQHNENGGFAKGNTLGNRWQKGESGNPNGRRNAYTDLIKQFSFTKKGEKERQETTTKSEPIQVMVIDDA